jgi:SAM-dependent methyltransferase
MAKKRRNRGPRRHRVESTPRADGGRTLEVDGFVQSVTVDLTHGPSPGGGGERKGEAGGEGDSAKGDSAKGDSAKGDSAKGDSAKGDSGYWELMLPERRPRRALIVGLGAGTIAALLARDFPGVAIVGIERDETVLALARLEFDLDAIPGLEIVVADAFADIPARAEREPGGYDYICLDLYEGGRLAAGTLATAFLRQLATLLRPEGTLAVNLFITARIGEQLHRLGRVFVVAGERRTRGNVVVHARLPAQPT